MNDDDDALENLPPPPTLRRQNAITKTADLEPGFFDSETDEIVSGNPDLNHSTNKNLVKLVRRQSGRCNPNLFFSTNNDRNDRNDDDSMSLTVGCTA